MYKILCEKIAASLLLLMNDENSSYKQECGNGATNTTITDQKASQTKTAGISTF